MLLACFTVLALPHAHEDHSLNSLERADAGAVAAQEVAPEPLPLSDVFGANNKLGRGDDYDQCLHTAMPRVPRGWTDTMLRDHLDQGGKAETFRLQKRPSNGARGATRTRNVKFEWQRPDGEAHGEPTALRVSWWVPHGRVARWWHGREGVWRAGVPQASPPQPGAQTQV